MDASIRERTQEIERFSLSGRAVLSANSKGRETPQPECPIRTVFQRDRDRVIHSNAFRRLKRKTQVFLAPECDHYRTRLTHTLEVSQIARTIARALRLNEDLTEAVALAHDLGHTPFGHAGEKALNECCELGFKHYEQSVRIVKSLERNKRGLNLTYEVVDGILNHTTGSQAATLEGQTVRVSDRIAYINHDIDDAMRAGILSNGDIPEHIRTVLGETKTARINTLVNSVIQNTKDAIDIDPQTGQAFLELHDFMFAYIYRHPIAKGEEGKAQDVVKRLYEYFVSRPSKLPDEYKSIIETEGVARAACDYIAGMTDHYALEVYGELFIPKAWQVY